MEQPSIIRIARFLKLSRVQEYLKLNVEYNQLSDLSIGVLNDTDRIKLLDLYNDRTNFLKEVAVFIDYRTEAFKVIEESTAPAPEIPAPATGVDGNFTVSFAGNIASVTSNVTVVLLAAGSVAIETIQETDTPYTTASPAVFNFDFPEIDNLERIQISAATILDLGAGALAAGSITEGGLELDGVPITNQSELVSAGSSLSVSNILTVNYPASFTGNYIITGSF